MFLVRCDIRRRTIRRYADNSKRTGVEVRGLDIQSAERVQSASQRKDWLVQYRRVCLAN